MEGRCKGMCNITSKIISNGEMEGGLHNNKRMDYRKRNGNSKNTILNRIRE